MAKGKELTFKNYIILEPDAEPVLWDSLPEEQKDAIRERWAQRLSETMSRYYSQHMDEYVKL